MSVRSVLGDVAPSHLGRTLVHEHLILDNELIRRDFAHIHLPSVDDAVAEVESCRKVGIGAMVDAMPAAGGRHPERLAAISSATDVTIVATTGLHTEKYYVHHPWAVEADPDVLASLFVDEIEVGIDRFDYTGPVIDRSDVRAGLIKVATDDRGVTDRARRCFAAAAEAQRRTGAPILTHTEEGLGGEAQVDLLIECGVSLDRVVISHTDKVTDLGYHTDLLSSGVNVEYDQALRLPPGEENTTATLIAGVVDAGFVDQVMVGTDGARRSLWASLGGSPGLAAMGTTFIDDLTDRGIDGDTVDQIFVDNPQRFLAFARAA